MKEGGQDNVDCVPSLGGPLTSREQEKGMAFAFLLSSTRLAMTSALAASFYRWVVMNLGRRLWKGSGTTFLEQKLDGSPFRRLQQQGYEVKLISNLGASPVTV